jgi:hypothetical protein
MKNKIVLGLAVLSIAGSIMMTTPASAGAPTKDVAKGPFVQADWDSPDKVGGIKVLSGDYLVGYVESTNRDADGNVTGYTSIFFDANMSPYGSLQVDKNLATGTLNLHAVPASRSEYDANHELIEASSGSVFIDIQVTWTGVGDVIRTPTIFNIASEMGGCITHYRTSGPTRNAVATGTIGGVALSGDISTGFLNGSTATFRTYC